MDVMITYDKEKLDALDSVQIMTLINKHQEVVAKFQNNMDYYMGNHAIANKVRETSTGSEAPNATPVCNHAKDISDTASGYFMGNPITYRLATQKSDSRKEEGFQLFLNALADATTDDDDQENALMLSIDGKCYEYIYAAEDGAYLKEKPIDPQNAFLVFDQGIDHEELFGVYYYEKKNDLDEDDEEAEFLYVLVMTETELKYYKLEKDTEDAIDPYLVEQHRLGYIPLVEYKNNRFAIGDFEQQIGLIDAYNTMTADRINDKEQFIDAILAIYGTILGDDETETQQAMQELRQQKLIELPIDARAEYLVRQLDESGMEILRDALKEDIYTFSHVPNLTDENFVGNSSGVAMEYKLLGLEMLTKTKERWYRRGLRKRINIFLYFLNLKGTTLEEKDIDIQFSRSLPKNLLELSQIVTNLDENVSNETLLGLLPFIEDPTIETIRLQEQKTENTQAAQQAFGQTTETGTENEPPEEEE